MADEYQKSTITTTHDQEQGSDVISADEIKDRGLFDFISGKKKEDAEVATVTTELEQVHVSEHEQYLHENKTHEDIPHHYEVEEEKKPSLLEKLHRSGSSSSSSSEEEVELEGGEKIKRKKKKGLKEKIKEKLHKGESEEKKKEDHYYTDDTSVPIEVVHETVQVQESPLVEPVPVVEEKKGFLEKIKEKLPGGAHKKPEDIPPPAPVVVVEHQEEEHKAEKKGIFEKIKDKIPGYHKHEETAVEKEIKEKEKDEKETPSHY